MIFAGIALKCFGKGNQGCASTFGELEILTIFYKNEMVTCVFQKQSFENKVQIELYNDENY